MTSTALGRRGSDHLADAIRDSHGHLTAAVGELNGLLAQITPQVIGVTTHILDSNGTAYSQYRVPFRALAVDHHGAAPASLTASGTVAAPAGNATIAGALVLPQGTWQVRCDVAIAGTPAAATDTGNMNLYTFPENVHRALPVPGTAGGTASKTLIVTMPAGGGTVTIVSTNAATAGTVYTAAIAADMLDSPSSSLIVAAAPLQGAAPSSGPGVAMLRSRGFAVVNLRANQWSIYGGAAGDLVTVTAFANPQQPTTR